MANESVLFLLRYAHYRQLYFAEPIGWSGHVVFAHALIAEYKPSLLVDLGVQYGNSFFTFCQSVHQHNLHTKCVGIELEQSTCTEINKYCEQYSVFAELKKIHFDEALVDFDDESIDIIHIDGDHAHKSIEHDFNAWLPKVKPGGIVLLYNINKDQDSLGNYKFWKKIEQLSEETYLFHHAQGLGVWRKPKGAPLGSQLLTSLLKKGSEEALLIDSFFTAIADREIGIYNKVQSDKIIQKNIEYITYTDTEYAKQVENFTKQLLEDKNIIKNLELNTYEMADQYKKSTHNLEETIHKISSQYQDSIHQYEGEIHNLEKRIHEVSLEYINTISNLESKVQRLYLEKERSICKLKITLQKVFFRDAAKMSEYQTALNVQQHTLNSILQSKSWRFTNPLRVLTKKLRCLVR